MIKIHPKLDVNITNNNLTSSTENKIQIPRKPKTPSNLRVNFRQLVLRGFLNGKTAYALNKELHSKYGGLAPSNTSIKNWVRRLKRQSLNNEPLGLGSRNYFTNEFNADFAENDFDEKADLMDENNADQHHQHQHLIMSQNNNDMFDDIMPENDEDLLLNGEEDEQREEASSSNLDGLMPTVVEANSHHNYNNHNSHENTTKSNVDTSVGVGVSGGGGGRGRSSQMEAKMTITRAFDIGFESGLEPQKILGHVLVGGERYFLLKWKDCISPNLGKFR